MATSDALWVGTERVRVNVQADWVQLAIPVHKEDTNLVVTTLSIAQLLVLVRAIRELREATGCEPLRFPWDTNEK